MTVQVKTTLNFKPLIGLRSNLDKAIGVKIGVLGSKDNRQDGAPLGNAGIGAIQEFGSVTNHIPPRSFLRMPLETKKDKLEAAFSRGAIKDKLMKGDVTGAMQLIGFVAEEIIDDAFKTNGFGKWAPNAPSTIASKESSKPLIDTGELRPSITSEVVQKA